MKTPFAAMLLFLGVSAYAANAPDPLARWIVVDGIRVRYLETGTPGTGGPVLLLLHGWAGSAEDFRLLLARLPPAWRAIAVDLPGCGMSDKPDAAYDLEFFMAFLRSFTVALGLDRFVLVGHSMGGQFAIHIATRWPDQVEKLILVDPYGMNGEGSWARGLAGLGWLVDVAFALDNRLFIEWALRANVLYKPSPQTLRAAADSASWILAPGGPRALARITRNVIGPARVDDLLPLIRQDTLLVWGDHDRLLEPVWAERFMALLPHARLEFVVDAGHMPMVDQPDATAALVEGFVGG